MIRFALTLLLLAAPASAWEFTARPICTISHDTGEVELKVTFDPSTALYGIRLTLDGQLWPGGPIFAIRFDGPSELTISTDRHQLSGGGRTLSVTDTGFGNVLNGLGLNRTATLLLGNRAIEIELSGAAEPVEDFRACAQGLNA